MKMDFVSRVYLGAILKHGMGPRLTRRSRWEKMVKHLREKGLIKAHTAYEISELEWNFEEQDLNKFREQLDFSGDLKEPETIRIAHDLWMEIALEECLEHLNQNMEKLNFHCCKFEDETVYDMVHLLEHFSVAQVYTIVDMAVAKAVNYYHEHEVSKGVAAATIMGHINYYLERALVDDWEIAKYDKESQILMSEFDRYVYDEVLRLGERGFFEVVDAELLRES